MAVSNYVVVDTPSKKIVGGPYAWDGKAEWSPPVAGTLMPASEARKAGYTVDVPTVPVTEQNRQTLTERAGNALATNTTYLGLAAPTAAQTGVQVKALTRQCNALTRLILNQFDSTD